jgi:hypothetical protein
MRFSLHTLKRPLVAILTLLVVMASSMPAQAATASEPSENEQLEATFTVQGAQGQFVVRAITRSTRCPAVVWDAKTTQTMDIRAQAATVPVRSDAAQSDAKPSVFPVLTCELAWKSGARAATVAGRNVAAPRAELRKIVLVADTGCRMKGSEKAFQDCNDKQQWPWAEVAASAARLKPDLVVHLGDIHYRESPCPGGNNGCADAVWGYGWDAWQADFFHPADPLLAAAPWLFVRGNHESCARAGQGWFRFIDSQAWAEKRSCNQVQNDAEGDFSEPYSVAITPIAQFVVFDSSKTAGKPYDLADAAFQKYAQQLRTVSQLADKGGETFFLSHHPLLAAVTDKLARQFKPGGNMGLQSVFESQFPERLFPNGVSVAMHGHVHLFEAISFASQHPVSLVLGNSGSMNEGMAPETLAPGDWIYKGAVADDYASRSDFGFASLDRVDGKSGEQWLLTEYTPAGVPLIECSIFKSKSRCKKLK